MPLAYTLEAEILLSQITAFSKLVDLEIFLQAYKTALAISAAQSKHTDVSANVLPVVAPTYSGDLSVVKIPQLVEQDFGFYEGKPFYARQRDSAKTGRKAHYDLHKSEPGFVDVESKVSLAERCDTFLDDNLLPLFEHDSNIATELVVAIVSHGILLSNLWRRLLLRLPQRSVTVAPGILTSRGKVVLEHLGGWSNTGFLEITIRNVKDEEPSITLDGVISVKDTSDDHASPARVHPILDSSTLDLEESKSIVPPSAAEPGRNGGAIAEEPASSISGRSSHSLRQKHLEGYATTVLVIDGKNHLNGFKRTRGGIGRAEFDAKQKTMESFFKRAKKE
ncbi:hypothetical protein MBLNU459_g3476t1 [Dothideomycetes sp. NU459]